METSRIVICTQGGDEYYTRNIDNSIVKQELTTIMNTINNKRFLEITNNAGQKIFIRSACIESIYIV